MYYSKWDKHFILSYYYIYVISWGLIISSGLIIPMSYETYCTYGTYVPNIRKKNILCVPFKLNAIMHLKLIYRFNLEKTHYVAKVCLKTITKFFSAWTSKWKNFKFKFRFGKHLWHSFKYVISNISNYYEGNRYTYTQINQQH